MKEDLRTWFRQKWVNIAKKKKGGGYEECGTSGKKRGYAKCVPAAKAASMSKDEIKSAVRRKRSAQVAAGRPGKEQTGQGNKPIMVKTMKEQTLQEKNAPTNPKLWAQAKSMARSKFDVYPSAYANGWAAKWYKKKGGGWRKINEELGKENEWGTNALTRKYKKATPGQYKEEIDVEQTIQFHDTLNPVAWDGIELKNNVRETLLKIANKFIDTFGIPVPIEDIVLTGSNANYNWTQYSDFDLHVIVNTRGITNIGGDYVRILLQTKKNLWNKQHKIKIKGFDVELYAQDKLEPHIATGVYSLLQNRWLVQPVYQHAGIDHLSVRKKAEEYLKEIDKVVMSRNEISINNMIVRIAELRKQGLSRSGEFSTENLVFKVLRNSGAMQKLRDALGNVIDRNLSIDEKYTTVPTRAKKIMYKLLRRKSGQKNRSIMMGASNWEGRKKLYFSTKTAKKRIKQIRAKNK
jgi:hypothetical protein